MVENTSRDEMKFRQQQAEEEMLKMWEKSTLPPFPPFVKSNPPQKQVGETPQKRESQPDGPAYFPKEEKKKGLGGLLGKDIFKFLNLDGFELNSDRMLILLMIVLLSGEDSDNILLFALAYIML